jgi:hypothetical protein
MEGREALPMTPRREDRGKAVKFPSPHVALRGLS